MASKVNNFPDSVHVADVRDAKLTGNPDDAVALSSSAQSVINRLGSDPKLITFTDWGEEFTVKLCDTSAAAA